MLVCLSLMIIGLGLGLGLDLFRVRVRVRLNYSKGVRVRYVCMTCIAVCGYNNRFSFISIDENRQCPSCGQGEFFKRQCRLC